MDLQQLAALGLFALIFGIMNMLGGRFSDVDPTFPLDGRLVFRCLLPGICAGLFALGYGFIWWKALYAWATVTAGSALWYSPGWSFDEITGIWSPDKYPAIMRRFGLWLVPNINSPKANRLRGIILKAIRGLFDVVTFASLFYLNPLAPAFLPGTMSMGPVYWLSGRLSITSAAVLNAEFAYGLVRGLLIGLALTYRGAYAA